MADVPQLGARGGGWVGLQFVLIPAVVAAGIVGPEWPDDAASALSAAGALLAVAGGAVVLLAARALGPSLTPFPRPLRRGTIARSGPYRYVRHPIYAGGILFFAGYSLAFSPWALALALVLAVVWGLKASVEERFLRAHEPAYEEYCARTRSRLVPLVY